MDYTYSHTIHLILGTLKFPRESYRALHISSIASAIPRAVSCTCLTYAILRLVVFLSEFVTVTEEQFASPHVEITPYHQITVMITVSLDGTSL